MKKWPGKTTTHHKLLLPSVFCYYSRPYGGQFTIKDYCSYQDALNLKNFEKVGIIVVDDVVIGMSSYELVVFLRYNMKLTCPIIFFGTSMHKGKRKAIQSGASYFFEKPFNPVELLDYVKELRI